jgi:cytidine deaminase
VTTPRQAAQLVSAARAIRARAHAPYSKFRVGAAVLDERGRVHVGCNVENASYGLSVCAERNAVAAAVAAGAKRIRAVAVCTATGATPCGACRQVIAERGDAATAILLVRPGGAARRTTLGALLPRAFALVAPRRRRGVRLLFFR